jgi:hypothetical protein
MKYFTFFIYTLLFITITVPVAIVIFDFFDIRFEVYGSYLFWFIALALFNAILPYNSKNIFEEETGDSNKNAINQVTSSIKNTLSPIITKIVGPKVNAFNSPRVEANNIETKTSFDKKFTRDSGKAITNFTSR